MSGNETSDRERSLEAGKKNGVHLLKIKKEFEGYSVISDVDRALVSNVTVHGGHIGISDYIEVEPIGFEITEDGTLDLRYVDTGSSQEAVDD